MIAEGFVIHKRSSPVTRPWEPIYAKTGEDRIILGLVIGTAHTNSRGLLHGGLIAALADNAMGLSLVQFLIHDNRKPSRGAVTTSLSIDYLGQAKMGEWLEIQTEFIHCGRKSGVTQSLVKADDRVIARVNASFLFGSSS